MPGQRTETRNRLAVDIGGTFTDLVLDVAGRRATRKVLTTPGAPERAVIDGAQALLADHGLALSDLDLFVHGTTLATNAIIERKGAVTALIATKGFRDTLEIADESRYDQYDIFIDKPVPLVPRRLRFTVPERVDAQGRVLVPLDEAAVRGLAAELDRAGVESLAVAFLHAYVNPAHEQRVRDILAETRPHLAVSLSCEVCPEIREYERTSTTVANAYVQPLMAGYLGRLADELRRLAMRCPLYLMTSGGGLTTLDTARRLPIRLVESGPAGGAILASRIAAAAHERKVLSFDMGGTTAKMCLIEDGEPQSARLCEVDRAARFVRGSGLPLRIPVIEMVEIGAGGGSIAHVDGMGRITVGPESAGAEPGPACYGRGGERPTVTDADVTLGRIDPERFAGGRLPLFPDRARQALANHIGARLSLDIALAAYGVCEMVDETMANAARVHAVERGKVLGDHTIIAFGGAAPLHACRLAEKLDVSKLIVPPHAGVGSAVGFLEAPVAFEVVRSRHMRLSQFDVAGANATLAEMAGEALAVVRAAAAGAKLLERRAAFMRYVGQGHEIVVELPKRKLAAADVRALRKAFENRYRALFSRVISHAEIEILTWSVTFSTRPDPPPPEPPRPQPFAAKPAGQRTIVDPETGPIEVPVYWRADLAPGSRLVGPALVAEDDTTTFVAAGFSAMVDGRACLVVERCR